LQAVGATKLGQQYLLSKALLESSTALNLAMYLLLKSEQHQEAEQEEEQQLDGNGSSGDVVAATTLSETASSTLVQSHPIMDRLQKLNALASKFEEQVEDKVPGLQNQIDNLVKASQFMAQTSLDGNGDDDDDEDSDEDSHGSAASEDNKEGEDSDSDKRIATSNNDDDDDDNDDDQNEAVSSSDDEAEEDKKAIAVRNALNEARFSLRLGEVSGTSAKGSRQNQGILQNGTLPFGDDDDEDDGGNSASQHLAATLNALEQRRSTATNREKRRAESMAEYLDGPKDEDAYNKKYHHDDHDDDNNEDEALQRGLDMMEADLVAKGADEDEDPDGDDFGGDDFYAQVQRKSRARKALKQERYAVAPKFPRLEPEGEDGQQRAVSQSILKNRGLVPHKPKINRNPRVKKRKQFDKALIRRRGAIRDVRAPQEGHQYGGEQTGIKSNISRSRKL
jgi:U3 small nucleolar RNA-associated protein 3